jgi:hypothetical protein
MPVVSRQQLAAFHATHYQIFDIGTPFTLRIGKRSLALQRLHQVHAAESSTFLTAWNPLGKAMPAYLNAERQSALRHDLDEIGLCCVSGMGSDPASGWTEESVLAIGLLREQAIALGNKYEQLAIVFCGENAVPELILLR